MFESLPLTVRNALVDACDEFERAWRSGRRPRIEDYLGVRTEPERTELLRMLLGVEVEMQRREGDQPDPGEYLQRFESDTEVIRTVFHDSAALVPWSSTEQGSGAQPRPTRTDPATTANYPSASRASRDHAGPPPVPATIGRYRVIGLMGRGNFLVYRARDDENGRDVAIKIAGPDDVSRRTMLLAKEAEALAVLDHPRIVKCLEYVKGEGEVADRGGFMVMELVQGPPDADTLEKVLKRGAMPPRELVQLLVKVAEAVHFVHTREEGWIHRDLKPSNILIDVQGEPHVCDFGLAVDEDAQWLRRGEIAGSLAYMAPEQVRGETHRLDGRTDIWAIGVILYRGLTHNLPFPDRIDHSVFEEILHRDPKPLRMWDPRIDPELERICLRCLARPMDQRYLTAADLAADLAAAIEHPPGRGESVPLAVAPKGLLSYDDHDAGFYPELLPGPRDRDGLPDCLRFWKTRVESTDLDEAFRVGAIYGPSGCGKTSLVKAGLLPRLSAQVVHVYAGANPSGTEARLLRLLRKKCPEMPGDIDLVAAVAGLRRGRFLRPGQKVLLVLDQFEQWLFGRRSGEPSELLEALRQCDGERVQALVLVRDDFWMALTRFMSEAEVDIETHRNVASVDLFDPRHARKVLGAFGRAYGALPRLGDDLSEDGEKFLDLAVSGLAQDGKVGPARLALFAQMVRSRPWTPATWREVGGAEGIGVRFLEETFDANGCDARHTRHRAAAQAVLAALLPETPVDIRGRTKTEAELRDASGYASRDQDFQDLIRSLSVELRLIMIAPGDDGDTASGEPSYQLTHDYLVHSLREWLDRKLRGSWRGRARILLADRAALWAARRDRRHLPPLPEFLFLRGATRRGDRTVSQQALLDAATRYHAVRSCLFAAGLLVLAALGWGFDRRSRARALVTRLEDAPITRAPEILDEMTPLRGWVDPVLRSEVDRLAIDPSDPRLLNARLALLSSDPSQTPLLRKPLLTAGPKGVRVIRSALASRRGEVSEDDWNALVAALWADLNNPSLPGDGTLCAAGALAELQTRDVSRWSEAAPRVVARLVASHPALADEWIDLLSPIGRFLAPELKTRFHDQRWSDDQRLVAAAALATFLRSDAGTLVELAVASSPAQLKAILPALRARPAEVGALLEAAVQAEAATRTVTDDRVLDRLARRRAAAATALLGIGQGARTLDELRAGPSPRVRTYLIHELARAGIPPAQLLDELANPRHDATIRQALILALGEYNANTLAGVDQDELLRRLLTLYSDDPEPGVHSAAAWLVRRLRPGEALPELGASEGPVEGRDWYVNRQRQTFAVVRRPLALTFLDMSRTRPRSLTLQPARPYCISTTEVTRGLYRKVVGAGAPSSAGAGDDSDRPIGSVSYYDALKFCRKLSELEGLDEGQMCYPPVAEIGPEMRLPADLLTRTGYRLPTEAEWLHACLGRAESILPYGSDQEFNRQYAWYYTNTENQSLPVGLLKPNDLGLFDMLGNVYEWIAPFPRGTEIAADVAGGGRDADLHWVLRGGGYATKPTLQLGILSYRKDDIGPSLADPTTGFRVVRTHR